MDDIINNIYKIVSGETKSWICYQIHYNTNEDIFIHIIDKEVAKYQTRYKYHLLNHHMVTVGDISTFDEGSLWYNDIVSKKKSILSLLLILSSKKRASIIL